MCYICVEAKNTMNRTSWLPPDEVHTSMATEKSSYTKQTTVFSEVFIIKKSSSERLKADALFRL